MNKVLFLFLISNLLYSCATFNQLNIDHPQTRHFNPKKKNFSDLILFPYKVNNAIVSPFFRGLEDKDHNSLDFRCTIYADNDKYKTATIHSYHVNYYDGQKWIILQKEINKEEVFKRYFDNTNIYCANFILFKNEKMSIQKTNLVKVMLDITVQKEDNPERKKINYDMIYEKVKYNSALSR